MRWNVALIAVFSIVALCAVVRADENNDEEDAMNGVPWPVVFPEKLLMEREQIPESPPSEPFEEAGFTVEESSWNNRAVRVSRFPLPAHSIHTPRLAAFRERYDFLEHIADAEGEFEELLLIRQWIRQKINISFRNYSATTDPFFILDESANGRGFVCTQYAAVMHACALAAGFTALTVHIDHDHGRNEPSTSHAVADVWVNELDKWVAFDAMYDVHYEKDGVPLSSIEIQAEYIRNGGEDVVPTVGVERRAVERARRNRRMTRGEISGYFWNKFIWGWDPFLNFGAIEQDMQVSYINDAHEGRIWWQGFPPDNYVLHAKQRGALHQTRRQADVNPDIGVCELRIRPMGEEGGVRVNVKTYLPGFKHVEVSFNGNDYEPLTGENEYRDVFDFEWELQKGENELSVRAVNEFDRPGRSTDVRVVLSRE